MDNETAQLRKEIQRLHQLLDIVLKANRQLEEQVDALINKQKILSGNSATPDNSSTGKDSAPFVESEPESGNKNSKSGKNNISIGKNNADLQDKNLNSGKISPHISSAVSNLQTSTPDISLLISKLKKLMKSAPTKSLHTTAGLLVQLQKEPTTSSKRLMEITGLSYDGLAKRIMVMKQRGWLVRRHSPQRLMLTDEAIQLLME